MSSSTEERRTRYDVIDWGKDKPLHFYLSYIVDGSRPFVELTDAEHADYKRVMAEFDNWQHRFWMATRKDPV